MYEDTTTEVRQNMAATAPVMSLPDHIHNKIACRYLQDTGMWSDEPNHYSHQTSRHGILRKVYEVEPLVCPKCSSDMKVAAVITNPAEISRILECLKKNKDPPFDNQFSEAS